MGWVTWVVLVLVIVIGVYLYRRSAAAGSTTAPAWIDRKNTGALEVGREYGALYVERTTVANTVEVWAEYYDRDDYRTEKMGNKSRAEAQAIREELKQAGWHEAYNDTFNYIDRYFFTRPSAQ